MKFIVNQTKGKDSNINKSQKLFSHTSQGLLAFRSYKTEKFLKDKKMVIDNEIEKIEKEIYIL